MGGILALIIVGEMAYMYYLYRHCRGRWEVEKMKARRWLGLEGWERAVSRWKEWRQKRKEKAKEKERMRPLRDKIYKWQSQGK